VKDDVQNKILKILDDKIDGLKSVLEQTIVRHSDAAFDLKDLKKALDDLEKKKNNIFSKTMFVVSAENEK
tara:strand:- start:1892 stop:2101 length:210 start_codon:yes stop_codon:yes gene_type:complete